MEMIGWIGFLPKKGQKEGEIWQYETTTEGLGKDEKGRDVFTITMHLDKPLREIKSTALKGKDV